MIRIPLDAADLGRTTFEYSPLAEITSSVRLLASGVLPAVHRPWQEEVRPALRQLDWPLLRAVCPYRHELPIFLFPATNRVTIEQELNDVAAVPPALVRRELEMTWSGGPIPSAARSVISDGSAGPGRIANALWDYWSIALEPYWAQIRAVLDDDLAHKRRMLVTNGISGVIAGLHPTLRVLGEDLLIDKPDTYSVSTNGAGLRFIPSVFVWPHVALAHDTPRNPSIAYGPRRLSRLWAGDSDETTERTELAALLGSTRAFILLQLELPRSTTALAELTGHSPASVSQHLGVLRRSALVTSWRSGRSVLYQRTALADQVITAQLGATPAAVTHIDGTIDTDQPAHLHASQRRHRPSRSSRGR